MPNDSTKPTLADIIRAIRALGEPKGDGFAAHNKPTSVAGVTAMALEQIDARLRALEPCPHGAPSRGSGLNSPRSGSMPARASGRLAQFASDWRN